LPPRALRQRSIPNNSTENASIPQLNLNPSYITKMQPHGHALTPIPDVVRAPSAPPLLLTRAPLPRPTPEFLVIGLFALRLTKRLTESLEYYPGRDVDIIWLVNFLAPFNNEYALAKISGSRKDDYLATYQGIVSRMKKQPKYPARFMQMNPDQSMQLARRGGETARPKALTDGKYSRISFMRRADMRQPRD
jgi:hypothetical protein